MLIGGSSISIKSSMSWWQADLNTICLLRTAAYTFLQIRLQRKLSIFVFWLMPFNLFYIFRWCQKVEFSTKFSNLKKICSKLHMWCRKMNLRLFLLSHKPRKMQIRPLPLGLLFFTILRMELKVSNIRYLNK